MSDTPLREEPGREGEATPSEEIPKGALLIMLLFFIALAIAWLVLYAEMWTRR